MVAIEAHRAPDDSATPVVPIGTGLARYDAPPPT